MRRSLAVIAVVSLLGCSDSTSTTPDGGKDAGRDATLTDTGVPTDAPSDAPGPDSAADASADAPADSGPDAAADSGADSGADAAADAGAASAWHTPTCDGTIAANEYGPAQASFTTAGNQVWSMTWNATNLYVALTNAAVAEAVVLYVGYGGNGLTSGQAYDSTRPSSLNFTANAVVYAKSNYNEVRVVSNNTWTIANGNVTFCGANTTRELVIPWTLLGSNGIPASFRWVGYATSSGGFVYGQVPQGNPAGNIGTNATFPNDYFVSSTANGSGAFPFATIE